LFGLLGVGAAEQTEQGQYERRAFIPKAAI